MKKYFYFYTRINKQNRLKHLRKYYKTSETLARVERERERERFPLLAKYFVGCSEQNNFVRFCLCPDIFPTFFQNNTFLLSDSLYSFHNLNNAISSCYAVSTTQPTLTSCRSNAKNIKVTAAKIQVFAAKTELFGAKTKVFATKTLITVAKTQVLTAKTNINSHNNLGFYDKNLGFRRKNLGFHDTNSRLHGDNFNHFLENIKS